MALKTVKVGILFGLSAAAWFLLGLLGSPASAVPADPTPYQITQPDGSTFTAVGFGDEFYHGVETRKGYTVLRTADGWWRYAETADRGRLAATGGVVGRAEPDTARHLRDQVRVARSQRASRTEHPGEHPGEAAPSLGSDPQLVILAAFTDQQSLGTTAAQWSANYFGASGSVRDYYREISRDQFDITPAAEVSGTANDGVVGWVQVPIAHPNDASDAANANAARAAIIAADPYVNYAAFDTDGNGTVTNTELHVTVIAAGQEKASCQESCTYKAVWGHMNELVNPAPVDGKWVGGSGYTEFGEAQGGVPGNPLHMATIGIMVHEMGHDLGLPDLYDIDKGSQGIGEWSSMSTGSWLWKTGDSYAGQTPGHFDAWSKWVKGWITPAQVTGTQTVQVNAAASGSPTNVAVQLRDNPGGPVWNWGTAGTGEYFLVENRHPVAGTYDAGLPGSGLLVLHIDESRVDNATDTQRLVDVLEADGLGEHDQANGDRGDPGDVYPGSANNRTANDTTNPNTNLNDGTASGVSISAISDAGPVMSAQFSATGGGGGPPTNDNFAGATIITQPLFSATASNASAGWQSPEEPTQTATCADLDKTLWFRYTPTRDVLVKVDTTGSTFDTVLNAWRGTSLTALTAVGCNDDAGAAGGPSAIPEFKALAGQTYYFQAGSFFDGVNTTPFGSLKFNFSARPANDDFAAATAISGATGAANGTNANASKETGEPAHAGNSGGSSVWFSWTAPATGPVEFDTVGSGAADTLLAAYTGNSVSALTMRAQNDDITPQANTHSRISFNAVAGQIYRIAVDGYGTSAANRGAIKVSWRPGQAPDPEPDPDPDVAVTARAIDVAGVTFGYQVRVARTGGDSSDEVTLVVDRPTGAVVSWAVSTAGDCAGSVRITCDLGVIDDGDWVDVELSLTPRSAGPHRLVAAVAPGGVIGANDVATAVATPTVVCDNTPTGAAQNVRGTGRAEVLCGLGGRDTLNGRGGGDLLFGGRGADTLLGGGAKDFLYGEGGRDRLTGGRARDRLDGGGGRDTCRERSDRQSSCER
jgi:M6 family metalloprotease-like protein